MTTGTTRLNLFSALDDMEYVHADLQTHRFPLHFHDTFVIEQVLAGVDWCSDSKLAAKSGEVFIHFPYAPHTGGARDAKRLVYQAMYPSCDLFCRLTGVGRDDVPVGTTLVSESRLLVESVRRLFSHFDSRNCVSSRSERDLGDLFCLVLEEYQASFIGQSSSVTQGDQMNVAREYLLANFERDISTAELSEVCNLSQFHLIRTFKRKFGITPRQFLISHRVSVAKRMIASGNSVATAAYATGFADQSHLTRHFKKVTSYSPGKIKLAGAEAHQN